MAIFASFNGGDRMKKMVSFAAIVLCGALVFAGGSKEEKSNVIKVGATPEPHAEMLKLVVADLAEKGYDLQIIEFTDYVTPNEALESGQIDANFFQHLPYMESFNREKGYHMVSAGGIHIEPIALYSKKVSSLKELSNGGAIAIPNDPTNEGRSLLLLQSAGLITLKKDAGLEATPFDIVDNPKNLKFKEIEAASLPRVLDDVEGAVINGNYAIPAGLTATKDGLYVEGADSPYVNIITVTAGHENDPKIVALVKALQSKKIADWIAKKYPNGEVVKAF
jgi:D-methionine transport system substrate-binding protein